MSRTFLARACAVLLGVSFLVGAERGVAAGPDEFKPLPAVDQQAVDAAAQAYAQGAPLVVLRALGPLVTKYEGPKLSRVDRELQSRRAPGAGELIVQARLSLLEQNMLGTAPRPTPREAVLMLTALDERFGSIVAEVDKHPVSAEALPAPSVLSAYEDLLWGAHVLENKLLEARRVVQYQAQLVSLIPKRALRDLTESERAAAQTDYGKLLREVDRRGLDLEERGVELRIQRLAVARLALEHPRLTAERFTAAYTWSVDAKIVSDFYKSVDQGRRQITRPKLRDTALRAEALANAKQSQELAGDLTPKAQWLFEGLHWWLRGRYGAGPELWGLAKSQAALRTPETMFQLYMPQVKPKATDPAELSPSSKPEPTYDRRHHYTWAWEDRKLYTGASLQHSDPVSMGDERRSSGMFEVSVRGFT